MKTVIVELFRYNGELAYVHPRTKEIRIMPFAKREGWKVGQKIEVPE